MATRHQHDSRVSRRQQTHLAVVGACLRWRVWCGDDLTFGLAVGVGHGSVVVVAVRAVVAVVSSQPATVSTDTVAIGNCCVELTAEHRTSWECRLWIAAQKSVSRIFMSRIFHPCSLVPIFLVPQFHVSHFQRPHKFFHKSHRHALVTTVFDIQTNMIPTFSVLLLIVCLHYLLPEKLNRSMNLRHMGRGYDYTLITQYHPG